MKQFATHLQFTHLMLKRSFSRTLDVYASFARQHAINHAIRGPCMPPFTLKEGLLPQTRIEDAMIMLKEEPDHALTCKQLDAIDDLLSLERSRPLKG